MEKFFDLETGILYFNPQSHVRFGTRNYLLWPAFAYKVIAPEVTDRKINFIQKAVLGFSRAGVYDPEKIAVRLYLHADLVAFIQNQLMDLGYLSDSLTITTSGILVLNDLENTIEKAVAGYVFQDPWSGELWPRFIQNLYQPDKEYREDGYPVILLGRKGKTSRISPYVVMPREKEIVYQCPEPKDILRATARHARAIKFQETNSGNLLLEDNYEEAVDISAQKLKRVSLIDQTPLPVFLTTYVYFPEDTNEGLDWFVCDPFGLGASHQLKKSIENRLPTTPGLIKYLSTIFQKSQEKILSLNEFYETNRIQAELKIEELLGLEVRSMPIFESLVALQCAHQEATLLGQNCRIDKLKDVLVKAQAVLEGIFIHLKAKYPIENAWKLLYIKQENNYWKPMDDRSFRKELLNQVADSLGFAVPLPDSLVTVKPEKIKSASAFNSGSLRPFLLATLLGASTNNTHPFRLIAKEDGQLLKKINDLADMRDASGHYQLSRNNNNFDLLHIQQQVETCIQIVSMFMPSLMEDRHGQVITK